MNMRKMCTLGFLSIVLAVLPGFGQAEHDILPLGPSEHKFSIAKIEKEQIMAAASEQLVSITDIVKESGGSDVFIIGEAHTSYECHTFQRDFIEALYKKNPKIVVGFEFFYREHDDFLEQWRLGNISEEDLLKETGWYEKTAYNYGYTRLVMDVIKKQKIKAVGLNVPRTILRQVSRKGFSALSEEEKALFPTIDIHNPEHEYFIKSVFGTFAVQVPMWFTNIYKAQTCWDVVMAESMRQVLAKPGFEGFQGVIIAGSNHVVYKLGIPFRYQEADKGAKLVTIVPVMIPAEKDEDEEDEEAHPMMKAMGKNLAPAAIFSRGIADYVFSIPEPEPEFFPVFGFKVEEKEGKIVVTDVKKESIAEQQGIREGDIVLALDGTAIESKEQLRFLLAVKNWGDSLLIKVEKKIEIKKEETEDK